MDKYVRLTRKSIKTLAGRVSARLRIANGQVSVVDSLKPIRPAADMEGLLRDLISMRTVTGDYEETHRALGYIDEYLSQRAMHVTRLEFNGFESLVATTRRTKTPKVLLAAHLDVVPGDDALFSLKEKNGAYYGRGTYDMKFAIPAFLQVVDDLQDNLQDYDFGIMITSDEEFSGKNGTGKLVEAGYRPKVVVLPDGGADWNLETFAKGVWHITLTATGQSAHGSRPWEGDSAIHKLLDGLTELRRLLETEDRKANTINIGTIDGGEVINQVADSASAAVDIRIGRDQDLSAVKKEVLKICKRYALSVKTAAAQTPIVNSLDNPLLSSFAASIEKIIGRKPGQSMSFGTSDARYFTVLGIPCAIVRPEGGNLHGPGEWISEQGFFDLREVIKDYIEREARFSAIK